jgi:hypothetical protein
VARRLSSSTTPCLEKLSACGTFEYRNEVGLKSFFATFKPPLPSAAEGMLADPPFVRTG